MVTGPLKGLAGLRARLPKPQASLRGRLLCLLLVAALPVLILVLAGTFAGYREAEQQALRDLAWERDHAVSALAGRIGAADAVLATLAATWPSQILAEPEACARLLRGIARDGLEVDGGCGAPSRAAGAGEITLRRSLGDGRVLTAFVPPAGLQGGLLAWTIDADGRWMALGAEAAAIGAITPAPMFEPSEVRSADGTALIAARGGLPGQSFLVVARPAAPLRDAAFVIALQRLSEVAALLALSALAVLFGAHYAVTRPLSRLRQAVAQWRGGAAFRIPEGESMPEEIRDLAESFRSGAEALAAREAELQAAITRAEILAAEVHHRVKNNLQVISSLLALQAQRVTDGQGRAEFEAARDRIGAIATLHRHMYAHHDPEAIDLAAFIEELGAQLFAAVGDKPGRRIALEVTAPALRISSDQAVPLALIITEAVSAALKQGFPGGQGGRIAIEVAADDRRATLAIEDDGATPRQDDPLRALLLRGLARQLGGELRREEAGLALEFPLRPPTARPPVSIKAASITPKAAPESPPAPSAPA